MCEIGHMPLPLHNRPFFWTRPQRNAVKEKSKKYQRNEPGRADQGPRADRRGRSPASSSRSGADLELEPGRSPIPDPRSRNDIHDQDRRADLEPGRARARDRGPGIADQGSRTRARGPGQRSHTRERDRRALDRDPGPRQPHSRGAAPGRPGRSLELDDASLEGRSRSDTRTSQGD